MVGGIDKDGRVRQAQFVQTFHHCADVAVHAADQGVIVAVLLEVPSDVERVEGKCLLVRVQGLHVVGGIVERAVRRIHRDNCEERPVLAGNLLDPFHRLGRRTRGIRQALPLHSFAAIDRIAALAVVVGAPPDDRLVESERPRVTAAEVPLAEEPGGVPRIAKCPGESPLGGFSLRHVNAFGQRHVVSHQPLLVGPAPGHQDCAVRSADRQVDIVAVERHALLPQGVEVRRLDRRRLRERHSAPAVRVAHEHDQVGMAVVLLGGRGARQEQRHQCEPRARVEQHEGDCSAGRYRLGADRAAGGLRMCIMLGLASGPGCSADASPELETTEEFCAHARCCR